MSAETLDPAVAALLDPDELAAINEGPDPDEVAALGRIAAGDDDDDDDDGDDDAGSAAGLPVEGAGAAPAPAAAQAPAAAASGEGEAQAPAPAPAAAQNAAAYHAPLPEDYQAQMDGIKAEADDLRAKFKAGDIDLDEYEEKRDALESKRQDLVVARTKAEVSTEMTQQAAMNRWQNAINSAFDSAAKPENGGIDYRTDLAKQADLDNFVRALANKPENADKDESWFLREAHKRVLALHDIRSAAAAPAPAPARGKANPADAPKTLAQVPGSDGPGDVGSEFADLDALDGEALELAIARMSPERRAKYAAGG